MPPTDQTITKTLKKEPNLFKLVPYKYYPLLLLAFSISVLSGLIFPAMALIFVEMWEKVKRGNNDYKQTAEDKSEQLIYLFAAAFITSALGSSLWRLFGTKLVQNLRYTYLKTLISQDMTYYDLNNPQVFTSQFYRNFEDFKEAMTHSMHITIYGVTAYLAGLGVALYKAPQLTLIFSILSLLILLAMGYYIKYTQQKFEILKNSVKEREIVTEQVFESIKVIKSLNAANFEHKKFKRSVNNCHEKENEFDIKRAVSYGFFQSSVYIVYIITLFFGAMMVRHKWKNWVNDDLLDSASVLAAFQALFFGIQGIFLTSSSIMKYGKGMLAAWEIEEVLDREPLIRLEEKQKQHAQTQIQKIEFENVNFSYEGRKMNEVVKNVSFEIKTGQSIAFVGGTGGGKSTIIQLLQRLYEPDSGRILIDDVDIKEYNLASIRKKIGYVTQEPILFAMTVKENLLLANPDASDIEIKSALEKASAWEVVKGLDSGLDTFVGEGGSQLSGGQRQRICIARTILQKPSILILDECTSALDRQNDLAVQTALQNLESTSMIISVAHRLSTVDKYDQIFYIKSGEILERGTHKQLIDIGGLYKELIESQFETKENVTEGARPALYTHLNKPKDKTSLDSSRDQGFTSKTGEETATLLNRVQTNSSGKKTYDFTLKKIYNSKPKDTIFSLFAALIAGACLPLFSYLIAEEMWYLVSYDSRNYGAQDARKASDIDSDLIWVNLGLILFAFLALILFTVFRRYSDYIASHSRAQIQTDLHKEIISKDVGYFEGEDFNPAEVTHLLNKDATKIISTEYEIYPIILSGFGSILSGLIITYLIRPKLAMIALCIAPVVFLGGVIDPNTILTAPTSTGKILAESRIFQQTVTNIKTIRSLKIEKLQQRKFESQCKKSILLILIESFFQGALFGVGASAPALAYSCLFYFGFRHLDEYGADPEDVLKCVWTIVVAFYCAGALQEPLPLLREASGVLSQIQSIFSTENQIEGKKEGEKIKKMQGTIEFRNVTFRYPGSKVCVLDNFNLKIEAGEKIGIAGISGIGKSTLFALLYRFYDVELGEILIGGKNIQDLELQFLRKKIGMVPQMPVLFNVSILNNIKYNEEKIPTNLVRKAIENSMAKDFIEEDIKDIKNLSEQTDKRLGYYRLVGMKGNLLSGGQKQKIAISRALVRKPIIYLFDEATSALDAPSELQVQKSLDSVSKGKTSLTISHRPSTIRNSDRIVVLHEGRVGEEGSYDELMEKKGLLWKLNKQEGAEN